MSDDKKLGIDIGITADTAGAEQAADAIDKIEQEIRELSEEERRAAQERVRQENEATDARKKRLEDEKKAAAEMKQSAADAETAMRNTAAGVAVAGAAVVGAGMRLKELAEDLRAIDPAAAEAMDSLGQVTEKAGTLVTTIATGFAAGGPIGAIAGTVVGLGKIILDEFEETNREILQMQKDNADLAKRIAEGTAQARKEILAEQSAELKKAMDRDNKILREANEEMDRFVKQRKEQLKAISDAEDAASKAKLAAIKAAGGDKQAEAEVRVDDAIRKFNLQSQEASLELHALRGDYQQKQTFATMAQEPVQAQRQEVEKAQAAGNSQWESLAKAKLAKVEAAAAEATDAAEKALEILEDTSQHHRTLAQAGLAKLQAEIEKINAEQGTNIQLPLETAAEQAKATIETAAKNVEETTRQAADAVQPSGQAVADAGQQLAGDLQTMASGMRSAAAAIPAETMQASYQQLTAAQSQAYEKIISLFTALTRAHEQLLTRLENVDRSLQLLQARL